MWTRTEFRTQCPNLESINSHSDFVLNKGSCQSLPFLWGVHFLSLLLLPNFQSCSEMSLKFYIPRSFIHFLYLTALPKTQVPGIFHGSNQLTHSCCTAVTGFIHNMSFSPGILKLYKTTNVEHLQLGSVLTGLRSVLGTSSLLPDVTTSFTLGHAV